MNISGTYKTQHGELTIIQYNEIIMATYQENGCCSGIINGNKVTGIWKNKKDAGIFCWNFDDENNFSGNYKNEVTEGPMRGKWDGEKITNQNDNLNDVVEFKFEVINDSNQQAELEITVCETLSDLPKNLEEFSINDYNTVITNEEILSKCKTKIEVEDVYFLENSSYYSLRLSYVNEQSLNFLWDKEAFEDYIELSKKFFKLDDDTTHEEIDEKIEEFMDDYYTSLDYVNSF